MNHHFRLIFLCTSICYVTGIEATFGETLCKKTKKVYAIICKKTRALYETAKEHKKLIAGLSVYLAFEVYGYSQDWDTPLQRLLTPKKVVDNTQVHNHGHAAQIAQLTQAHQQKLQVQQRAYQELQQRCTELQNEVRALHQELHTELTRKLKREQQFKEVSGDMSILKEKSLLLLDKWAQLKNS